MDQPKHVLDVWRLDLWTRIPFDITLDVQMFLEYNFTG